VSVAFSPDGQFLASGGDDSKVRLWRVDTTLPYRTLDNDARHVYGVQFSADGRLVAAGGRDKGPLGEIAQKIFGSTRAGGRGTSIRIWDVETGLVTAALAGHDDDVNDVQFSADGRWMASAGEDRTIVLWSLQ
jgi:WD40 repeat protein